jgi:hypothetical protein
VIVEGLVARDGGGRFRMRLEPQEAWTGKPILQLPHFDELFVFLAVLAAGARLRVAGTVHANPAFCDVAEGLDLTAFSRCHQYLEIVSRARRVARSRGMNPAFRALQEDDIREIVELDELLKGESVRRGARGARVRMRLERMGIAAILARPPERRVDSRLVVEGPKSYLLLGEPLALRVRVELTHMALLSDTDSLRGQVVEIGTQAIEVEWEGGENSEIVTTLVNTDGQTEPAAS